MWCPLEGLHPVNPCEFCKFMVTRERESTEDAGEKAEAWAIQAYEITKKFGSFLALRGVDLKIRKGEFLTLFGPNGAGKTTLVKILSTLSKPTSGTLIIGNANEKQRAVDVRRRIGVISHHTFLYEDLTAEENLKFYGKMYGVANLEERVLEVIELVGLEHRAHDYVRTFSRGMQQRLSIARAIIHDPSMLLLDEPDTGLDQHAADMLREAMRTLVGKDRSIIMTTHNLERGLEMCDRAAILKQGRVVFDSPKEAVDHSRFREMYYEYTGEKE